VKKHSSNTAPLFLWQPFKPKLHYNDMAFQVFYNGWETLALSRRQLGGCQVDLPNGRSSSKNSITQAASTWPTVRYAEPAILIVNGFLTVLTSIAERSCGPEAWGRLGTKKPLAYFKDGQVWLGATRSRSQGNNTISELNFGGHAVKAGNCAPGPGTIRPSQWSAPPAEHHFYSPFLLSIATKCRPLPRNRRAGHG
jgi:hypothetical protein